MLVDFDQAVDLLQKGEVVALPTETVYGLAGRMDRQESLEKIFLTKQRPLFDPLIVHVHSQEQARSLVSSWPLSAELLAKRFWPGPLTLVLPKKSHVSDLVTSGLAEVALRIPRHPLFLKVLHRLAVPLAAPSANHFGKTSPTCAAHVEEEFQGRVPVLDGGSSEIGIESCIVRVQENFLEILRSGLLSRAEIQEAAGGIPVREVSTEKLSPGQFRHHYMPAKLLVYTDSTPRTETELCRAIEGRLSQIPGTWEGVQLIRPERIRSLSYLNLPEDPRLAARVLYAELRRLSVGPSDAIVFQRTSVQRGELWDTLLIRLKKAAVLQF